MPLLAMLAAGGVGMLWLALAQRDFGDDRYDQALCPTTASGPSGLAVLLFDLTKPLAGLPPGLPGQLLRDLTLELERDTEVRTYVLTGSSSAPRQLLKRLCKPFDPDVIQVATAKDHAGGTRDCDDLPAQMAPEQRRSASRFCELRETLAARLNILAQRASERSWGVAGAHLVEALEQTRADFLAQGAARRVLHVVSDMVQHADWYSHLDLPAGTWNDVDHGHLRASSHRLRGRWESTAPVDVHIHYLPRDGLTALPEAGDSHRRFWRLFFGAEQVTFHDQPSLRAYASMPLMVPATSLDAVRTTAVPPRTEARQAPPPVESEPAQDASRSYAVEERVEQVGALEAEALEPSAAELPKVSDQQLPEPFLLDPEPTQSQSVAAEPRTPQVSQQPPPGVAELLKQSAWHAQFQC